MLEIWDLRHFIIQTTCILFNNYHERYQLSKIWLCIIYPSGCLRNSLQKKRRALNLFSYQWIANLNKLQTRALFKPDIILFCIVHNKVSDTTSLFEPAASPGVYISLSSSEGWRTSPQPFFSLRWGNELLRCVFETPFLVMNNACACVLSYSLFRGGLD